MNMLAARNNQGLSNFTPQQLNLIQRTAAKDCNPAEFDEFMHVCDRTNLDPLRRQIYALVYNKNKPNKRQMVIIIGIDGYRAIAERSGNYRPADKPTDYVINDELKSDANPLGIESATVTLYKHSHGEWFPVVATAYWDEYAPIKDKRWDDAANCMVDCPPVLDDKTKWPKMPRQMIEKCAQAKAHRSGWPDDFSGTYDEAELDQMKTVDLSASEWAEQAATENRLELVGGKDSILFDFPDDEAGLRPVPVGKLGDEIMAFIKRNPEPDAVEIMRERNQHPLNQFWAVAKSDALECKRAMETVIAQKPS